MANFPPSFPGIAGATGTRVDSAAKHIMACKVNDNLLAQWCEDTNNARNHLYPKPYMLTAEGADHYGDKIRIFAKCINGGRPYEMVDLMLMTQSL